MINTLKATNGDITCEANLSSPVEEIIEIDSSIDDGGGVEEASNKPCEDEDKPDKNVCGYLGIFIATLAATLYSLNALIIKSLNYEPYNLGVWRFLTVILLSIPFLIHGLFFQRRKNNEQVEESSTSNTTPTKNEDPTGILEQVWPPNTTTGILILQAILGSNAGLFVSFGVKYLNIEDAIVIATSAPILVTFAAWIYLGERCGVVPVLLALCALFGVGILCKPPLLSGRAPLNKEIIMGFSFSLASMILLTVYYVMIRILRKVHHALVQFTFALWGFIESIIMAVILEVLSLPQGTLEICLVIGSAVLLFLAQTCVIFALKYEQAGVVTLTMTLEVPLCYLWEFLLLDLQPTLYSVIGASMTLGCVMVAALRKAVMSLEEDSPYRKRFEFLLY